MNIKNKTQVETWWGWYRNLETHRFKQPAGKQYTFGKGSEKMSELEELKLENRFLTQQLEVLKITHKSKGCGRKIVCRTS